MVLYDSLAVDRGTSCNLSDLAMITFKPRINDIKNAMALVVYAPIFDDTVENAKALVVFVKPLIEKSISHGAVFLCTHKLQIAEVITNVIFFHNSMVVSLLPLLLPIATDAVEWVYRVFW